MNIFRRSRERSRSPSFEIPKLCLPRQKRTNSESSEGSHSNNSSGPNLDVPLAQQHRIRSSSFDTSSLHHEETIDNTLHVPGNSRRACSFDSSYSGGDTSEDNVSDRESSMSFLGVPKYYRRRSLDIPKLCIHCVHLEALSSQEHSPTSPGSGKFSLDGTCQYNFDSNSDSDSDDDQDPPSPQILTDSDGCHTPDTQGTRSPGGSDIGGDACHMATLGVPLVKPRSSSMDAAYMQAGGNEDRRCSLDTGLLDIPKQPRSSSVDVNLPTAESACYRAIASKSSSAESFKKAIHNSSRESTDLLHPRHAEIGYKKREIRSTIDWSENAVNGDHVWVDTNASGDFCYVGENECSKSGPRKKCAACKILVHTGCMVQLERINFKCKPTFREAGPRNYREQTFMRHHWVHRRRQEGKCKQCGKSFQQRFAFQSKEIIAISCSWCKSAYHNKVSCFMMQQIEEQCTLGIHAGITIPPSWIIKLPRKGSFKSSIRKKKKASLKKRKSREEHKPFIIKPIPSPHMKPVVVFINPKSGGNQGAKLMHKFQWLLNPRQVFDLSQGGPRMGLELFKKVPNLRILACGGDGTAGWILSTIDSLAIHPAPPVAVLPLGTGNDLARTLNWGGGYTDEPISKVLCSVEDGPVVQLDRWDLHVTPNCQAFRDSHTDEPCLPTLPLDVMNNYVSCGADAQVSLDFHESRGKIPDRNSWNLTIEQHPEFDPEPDEGDSVSLPLDVMNNYFSLGADAHVTLEFHESREANPEKFNSRFRNKMFYAGAGGKDLLKRSWKDLAEHITVICDGVDLTPKIKELKLHCLVFLNIPKYAAGTSPWGNPSLSATSFEPQRHDDGYLEVIGFTTTSLATLYVGGHGERLVQCQSVELTTYKTIPMQVDGEPCRLLPSKIRISLRNQANVVQKPKRRGSVPIGNDPPAVAERLRVQVSRISMADYEALHYDKDKLREASVPLGIIVVENDADLEQVRKHINRLHEDTVNTSGDLAPQLSSNWCFVDSTTADRFFRIDRGQEHLHYVTDISSEDLYILDPELQTSFLQNNNNLQSNGLSSPYPMSEASLSPASALTTPLEGPSLQVTPPTAVIIHDAEMSDRIPPMENGHGLKFTFPAPVNHRDSQPGSEPHSPNSSHPQMAVKRYHAVDGSHGAGNPPTDKMLIDASKRGDLGKLVELQQSGANLLATDQYGMTALHHAARFGHKDVVKHLLENAPPVILDMVDHEKGQTALHKSAWYQRRTICCMLVASGASLTKTDFQGNTPRLQALKAEDKELAGYLESQEHLQLVVSEDQETAV